MLVNVVYAESPREQLKQMTGQLQKTPDDNALREKIIKLAQEFKPALAVPAEAERFEGRAQFAFKHAKSTADYLDAAKVYEKAVAAAPWVPRYYSDLCTIYEKAEKYAEAKKNCEFYRIGLIDPAQVARVKRRIARLGGVNQDTAAADNSAGSESISRLNGSLWRLDGDTNYASCVHEYFEMHKDQLIYVRILDDAHAKTCPFERVAGRRWQMGAQKLSGPDFFYVTTDGRAFAGNISEDGDTITVKVPDNIPPPGSSSAGFNTRILFRKVN